MSMLVSIEYWKVTDIIPVISTDLQFYKVHPQWEPYRVQKKVEIEFWAPDISLLHTDCIITPVYRQIIWNIWND